MSVIKCIGAYNGKFENTDAFNQYPYLLSDFQKWAIDGFLTDKNVLVTAHTGSGKTLPAEFAINQAVTYGKKVIYTSPIKSLSNQKFQEFKLKFPNASVGILTGDVKYNPEGNVLIMTTEILRNLLFKKKIHDIKSGIDIEIDISKEVHCVIFDEIHYINDADRGHVWEEALILLPNTIQIMMLSATIANPEIFAEWLATIKKRDIVLTSTDTRVVPLRHSIYTSYKPSYLKKAKSDSPALKMNDCISIFSDENNKFNADFYSQCFYGIQKTTEGLSKNIVNDLIGHLTEKEKHPSLFFCFSRIQCEKLATSVEHNLLEGTESCEVDKTISHYLRKTDFYHKYIALQQFNTLRQCLLKGIDFHHSGLLPIFKEIIEILYSKNLVKVLFATETFAVGVNMPTKTVVFTNLEKYTDTEFRLLLTHEYLQMAGRAGRRGLDKEGSVILLPGKNGLPQVNQMKNLVCGSSQSIQSKFTPNYHLILKIILNGNSLEDIINGSLLFKETNNHTKTLEEELKQLRAIIPNQDYSDCIEYVRLLTPSNKMGTNDTFGEYFKSAKVSAATSKKHFNRVNEIALKPGWNELYSNYKQHKNSMIRCKQIEDELSYSNDYIVSQSTVVLKILCEQGYIKKSEFPMEKEDILVKGIAANEIHECNEILMTEMLFNGCFDNLDYKYLGALLSIFGDSRPINKEYICESQTEYELSNIMPLVKDTAIYFENLENQYKIHTTNKWNINVAIMDAVYEWLDGGDFQEIILNYDLYEGSLIKDFLKVYNLSTELEKAAEIAGKLGIVVECSKIRDNILRDIVNVESLYIKS